MSAGAPEAASPTVSSSCVTHPHAPGSQRCKSCERSFCEDCTVTLRGEVLCGPCKNAMALVLLRRRPLFRAPSEALTLALLAIFCFGFIVAPLAIIRAVQALRAIRRDPSLPGRAQAIAAIVISVIVLIAFVASVGGVLG